MIQQKNKLMIWMSSATILVSLTIHLVHRQLHLLSYGMIHNNDEAANIVHDFAVALNVMMALPVIFLVIGICLYKKNREHKYIPIINTIALTFGCFSMIAGGGGTVEYHFSIFMAIAIIAYYENILLTLVMTVLFALQHILGFLIVPELVFGAASYPFVMVLTHALFLLATSAATILQIISKKRITTMLEAEKNKKQSEIVTLLTTVKQLSDDLEETSVVVSQLSEGNIRVSTEMLQSFKEVSTGLDEQSESLISMENSVQSMTELIEKTSQEFTKMQMRTVATEQALSDNRDDTKIMYN